ncbi:MAG: MinD/ParA family protein [Treponema sp.]|nr:MinD/ParA family protein [Treponema sp.]
MAVVIPVAGGKGGVGKSVISLNLSAAMAAQYKHVILCDLDFGGANLHTMLGLKNNQTGLGHFINKLETNMNNLVQATGVPNFHFIAGDCLFPGTANMDFFTKQKIIREIVKLECDYLILDLGAGSAHNQVDFFIMTNNGLLVVTPEITSILNAYSFLKSVVYRFCYRSYSPKSNARIILKNAILQRLEGRDYSFEQILNVIDDTIPGEGKRVFELLKQFRPRIIMNMGRSMQNTEMGYRLQQLARNKLAIDIDFIGYVPYDESVQFAIAQRQPAVIAYPNSIFSKSLLPIIQRIYTGGENVLSTLQDAPEDFADIVKEFYENKAFRAQYYQ